MKNLLSFSEFTNDFINESNENEKLLLDLIIESEISDELNESNFELDQESINELNYLSENLSDFHWMLEKNPYILLERVSDSEDIEMAKRTGARSGGKKVVNALGWMLFPAISLYRAAYKTIAKKVAIRKLIKKETDPEKKEKLRLQLKELTRAQVKAYEKIQQAKEKVRDKKDQLEGSKKIEEMPAAKREEIVKQAEKTKEEVQKIQQEIEKAKEKGKK